MDLTIFEVHLDGAQFGPSIDGERETETEQEDTETDATAERAGPNPLVLVVASIAMAIGATLVARRLFGDDEAAEGEDTGPIAVDVEE